MTLEEKRIRYEKSVKRAKKFALNAVIVLVAVAASGMFIGYLTEGLQAAAAEATYEDVRGDIVESGSHEINFTVVQERGSTSTSWIYLPDTDIDYPMVQGPDNDMYLDVDAYGNPSKAGAIFINYANDKYMSDPKTVIFGHNMNDGSMFTPLHKYKDEEWGSVHSDAYIFTDDGMCKHYRLRYYIFTEPTDEAVYVVNNGDDAVMAAMKLRNEADIIYGEHTGGNLICLSTCTYHTKRTVVVFEHVDNKKPIAGMSKKMTESLSTSENTIGETK